MKKNTIYFTLIPMAFLIAILSLVFNNFFGRVYAEESLTKVNISRTCSKLETNKASQEISDFFPVRGKTGGQRWTFTHRGVEFHFRWCPPGSFVMGSPENEKDRYKNEIQHKVTLTRGFWILETEVTQKMFQAVTGKNPSEFRGDQKPVDTVNWQECVNFCQDLTKQFAESVVQNLSKNEKRSLHTEKALANRKAEKALANGKAEKALANGKAEKTLANGKAEKALANGKAEKVLYDGKVIFTLPTEAQWEYACRSGTKEAFAGPLEKLAWFGEPNETGSTHPVGTKQPNNWGIYDMHGNLWEWCADWYRDLTRNPETDPRGPKTSDCGVRIDRGGCWDSSADYCRSAHRGTYEPDRAGRYVGFRIVVTP